MWRLEGSVCNALLPLRPSIRKMSSNVIPFTVVAIRHRLQTGQAASYNHLTNVDDVGDSCHLSSRGGFLAWRRAGKQTPFDFFADVPSWIPNSKKPGPDTVICRRVLEHAGQNISHPPASRPTICLRKTEGMRGEIKRLRMNSDGLLLISVACPPLSHKESRSECNPLNYQGNLS
jgi:hypothetical protein